MIRTLSLLLLLLAASLALLHCGTSTSGSGSTSGLPDRAFISQNATASTVSPGVYIVDAQKDVRAAVAPMSAGAAPGMMVLTPNRNQTLVFSPPDNLLTIISNAAESGANSVTLPGFTESFVVSPDSVTAYAAVPTAAVIGQSPGVVKAISLSNNTFTGEVDVPSVRYLSIGNLGNRVLAFSDNSDSVAVITTSNIGLPNAVTYVSGFDRPVAAFFSSDDTTAFVVNCGAECGGTQASVQRLDLTSNTVGASVNVPAATVAMVNGSTMYLAGTPVPAPPCTGQTTAATQCGLLTVVDLPSLTVTNPADIVITDGYHNHISLAANGRVYVGARTCTEITAVNTGDEVRGCLSIYNTQNGAVVIPPATGEVTGIQPIAQRTVVYVVQGGSLGIYDTSTDKLTTQQVLNFVGEFVDVKQVDF